jgi:hypothetical protein
MAQPAGPVTGVLLPRQPVAGGAEFDPLQNSAATRSLRVGIWGAFRPALREPWVPARRMALEMSSSDGQRGIRLDTFCRIIMLESAENSDRECHQSNSGNRQVGQ